MQNTLSLKELTLVFLKRVRAFMPPCTIPDFEPPPLPAGLIIPEMSELNTRGHFCDDKPFTLPIALIVPGIHIYFQKPDAKCYVPDNRTFTTPYWIGPVTVEHDMAPEIFRVDSQRRVSVLENACVLCQYPWVGSLRSLDDLWGAQVFFESFRVIGKCDGSGPRHHATWAPKDQVKEPQSFLRWET